MAVLRINVDAVAENVRRLDSMLWARGMTWTPVLKLAAGDRQVLGALLAALPIDAVVSVGDSRVENLATIRELRPETRTMLVRPPAPREAAEVVRVADVSCVSALPSLRALDAAARAADCRHGVVLMVEMGEMREGAPPAQVEELAATINGLDHLDLAGIGTNLGCLRGVVPRRRHLEALRSLADTIGMATGRIPEICSAGGSIALPLIDTEELPPGSWHFRVGEAAFLGTTPATGDRFADLRTDAVRFTARIVELSPAPPLPGDTAEEIATVPSGRLIDAPAAEEGHERIRAILDFGRVDVDLEDLAPVDRGVTPTGITSELAVCEVDADASWAVGDRVEFRPSYIAAARLMQARYVTRERFGDGLTRGSDDDA